jgi:hypothetical protein
MEFRGIADETQERNRHLRAERERAERDTVMHAAHGRATPIQSLP